MIALDTNILARFYVDDPHDPEAGKQPVGWVERSETHRVIEAPE